MLSHFTVMKHRVSATQQLMPQYYFAILKYSAQLVTCDRKSTGCDGATLAENIFVASISSNSFQKSRDNYTKGVTNDPNYLPWQVMSFTLAPSYPKGGSGLYQVSETG